MTNRRIQTRHLQPSDLRGRRWRGLVRESTEAQAERWSPDRQREDLRRAADELGLIPAYPEFYERVGSGEETGAPEVAQALEDGKAGQYDVLLVLHTSRFGRNRAETVRNKGLFREAGIVIYFTAQRLISGSYAGALTEGINEVIDEHENEQRRFWIAGGIRQRQLSGRWIGAIPFGYRKALVDFTDGSRGWDGGLEPDPDTAPVVREIFDAIAAGSSFRQLAVSLNARGLRTGRGLPWTSRSVGVILSNPIYAGRALRYRRHHAAHYYAEDGEDGRVDLGAVFPAIVDPVLWDQVQQIVESNRPGQGARDARAYPLSGTLRCRSCGNRMNGMWSGRHRYYRCVGRIVYATCDAVSIRADVAEQAFADWLATSWHLPPDWRAEIARTTVQEIKASERDRQASLSATLERIHKQYRWGEYESRGGDAAYRRDVAEIKEQMGVMAKPTIANLDAVADALQNVGPAWASATPDMRATIPPLMLKAAEVDHGEIVTWVVHANLKPLLDLCTRELMAVAKGRPVHAVRFSA